MLGFASLATTLVLLIHSPYGISRIAKRTHTRVTGTVSDTYLTFAD